MDEFFPYVFLKILNHLCSNISLPLAPLGRSDTNPCEPNPCKNGGICSADGGAAVCKCPAGFKPPYCEQKGMLYYVTDNDDVAPSISKMRAYKIRNDLSR